VQSDGAKARSDGARVRHPIRTFGPDPRTGPSHLRPFAPSDRIAAYLRTAIETLNAAPGIVTPAIS